MDNLRTLIGSRIKNARKRINLSQKELAKQAGLPSYAETISKIEKGEREVKAWELVNIARVLRISISELLASIEPKPLPFILWRKEPKKDRILLENSFIQFCKRYHIAERLCGMSSTSRLPKESIDPKSIDDTVALKLANQITNQLNLGSRPAKVLAKILEEDWNVKIWYKDLGEQGSAATVVGEFGPAILINSSEAPWRRNFSFAHEVFHLITWDSIPPKKLQSDRELTEEVERIAEAFASNLLLPFEPITVAFKSSVKNKKILYIDLVKIAREFDVSTEALIYRLCNLRLIDWKTGKDVLSNPRFRTLDKESMHRHWRNPPPIPERFVRLAFSAFQAGKLSRSRLAEFLNTSLIDLPKRLMEYEFNEQEDYETEINTS
ncbi:MAG: hypothetical protein AMJ90_05105 [candidate division Zixibacteria bacterium SM23_73_2]|nr:MAG: hypothetical protein AMJ90_05105 [candidate division Zixibacteria bacterium SM23_73_2]